MTPKVEDTRVQIGHKDGFVVLNMFGTSEVPESFLRFSPEQAREVARQIILSADRAARDREGP